MADIAPLERAQGKALALCLPSTAIRNAMEVAANILPLDLRVSEIAIRDIGKIAAKPSEEPIKQQQLINCMNRPINHLATNIYL